MGPELGLFWTPQTNDREPEAMMDPPGWPMPKVMTAEDLRALIADATAALEWIEAHR